MTVLANAWRPEFLAPAVALGWSVTGFMIYHFATSSARFEARFPDSVRTVICRRGIGVLVFGFVPLALVFLLSPGPLGRFGLALGREGSTLPLSAGLGAVGALVGALSAGRRGNRGMYPQIRTSEWSGVIVAGSALSWTAYLVAYEFLYRGILLFTWVRVFGYWPALLVGVAVYVLIHVPKGGGEAAGSVLFGVVLSAVTLETGTILFAVVTHVAMALSNEWLSIARHPDMRFIRRSGK